MKKLYIAILLGFIGYIAKGQCNYFPITANVTDTVSYTRSGGSFQSWGCTPIDPTYWMNASGQSVTITFAHPQTDPTFRVFGMNDDDTGAISVNGDAYFLNASNASYNTKIVCGSTTGDGVTFSGGKLTGTTSANFSYQDVQLRISGITTILITSLGGAGWGVAGVSVGCPLQDAITEIEEVNMPNRQLTVYPNPFSSSATILFNQPVENVEAVIYNLYGQKIQSIQNISGDRVVIKRSDLPVGIYYISVEQKGATIALGKLTVVN